jgi:aldehyde dehydrogenase
MRIFQEEIFGPVLAFTTFKDEEEAVKIANDTIYGLGAGVWTRDAHQLYNIPRQIEAGRVWVNQYHHIRQEHLSEVQTIRNRKKTIK